MPLSESPYKALLQTRKGFCSILQEKGVNNLLVIAGVNLPLAVTAVLMKDKIEDLQELKEKLLEEGKASILECAD